MPQGTAKSKTVKKAGRKAKTGSHRKKVTGARRGKLKKASAHRKPLKATRRKKVAKRSKQISARKKRAS